MNKPRIGLTTWKNAAINERNILTHAGMISHPLAEEHAHAQFAKYETERRKLEATA